MTKPSSVISHPENFLWGVAVKAAEEKGFQFSLRCEATMKDQIRSGMDVCRVGLYEFRDRMAEAEANMRRLVDTMIGVEQAFDSSGEFLQESSFFTALYRHQLCPGLWPLC